MKSNQLIWLALLVAGTLYLVYLAKFKSFSFFSRSKPHHSEILKVLLNLNDDARERLFKHYQESFGSGAARYARKTYRKWKTGKVRPNRQTFERFLLHLPKVMSYDLKCEVLRHFMEEYSARDDYQVTVYTDDWEKTLTPLVRQIIEKPFQAELPKEVESKLSWLADGEMQLAREILKRSQVEEGKIAVSMLREEFENIEKLLSETRLKLKVTHRLKFPYGTVTVNIKRR